MLLSPQIPDFFYFELKFEVTINSKLILKKFFQMRNKNCIEYVIKFLFQIIKKHFTRISFFIRSPNFISKYLKSDIWSPQQ